MSDLTQRPQIKEAQVLDCLVREYPNILRKGWRKKVPELLPTLDPEDQEELVATILNFTFEPDSAAIDVELRELIFFEVEVTSLMTDRKLQAYGKLAIDLCSYDIAFALATINRHGHINEINLLPHYAAWLREGPA